MEKIDPNGGFSTPNENRLKQPEQCIYCKKSSVSTEDFNREHVIPGFLGKFKPQSPVLVGLVCRACNSRFSELEWKFKADTTTGILCQMFNLDKKPVLKVHNHKAQTEFSYGGSKTFDKQFPQIAIKNGRIEFYPKDQVLIYDKQGGYTVILVEQMQRMKKGTKKYKKIIETIKIAYSKRRKKGSLSIFAEAKNDHDNSRMKEIIEWLQSDFGIEYKETKREYMEMAQGEEKREMQLKQDITIDHELGIVIAKITLNYLAYSAQKSGEANKLLEKEFDPIRRFINGDKKVAIKDIISSVTEDAILWEEKETGMRLPFFCLTFKEDNGKIVGRVSFFGGEVFEVQLGDMPLEWKRVDFGSGHAFNPFENKISNLTQGMRIGQKIETIPPGYGLYRRLLTQPQI